VGAVEVGVVGVGVVGVGVALMGVVGKQIIRLPRSLSAQETCSTTTSWQPDYFAHYKYSANRLKPTPQICPNRRADGRLKTQNFKKQKP